MLCPSKSNSNTTALTVHTSCYWGLRLTLCYLIHTPVPTRTQGLAYIYFLQCDFSVTKQSKISCFNKSYLLTALPYLIVNEGKNTDIITLTTEQNLISL